MARRTKSRGPKGLQLEVGAQRAPKLLVWDISHILSRATSLPTGKKQIIVGKKKCVNCSKCIFTTRQRSFGVQHIKPPRSQVCRQIWHPGEPSSNNRILWEKNSQVYDSFSSSFLRDKHVLVSLGKPSATKSDVFLDAIVSPSSYPCQSVSQWVSAVSHW